MAKLPIKPPRPFVWLSTARLVEEMRAHGSNYRADLAARGLPFQEIIQAGPGKLLRGLARLRADYFAQRGVKR